MPLDAWLLAAKPLWIDLLPQLLIWGGVLFTCLGLNLHVRVLRLFQVPAPEKPRKLLVPPPKAAVVESALESLPLAEPPPEPQPEADQDEAAALSAFQDFQARLQQAAQEREEQHESPTEAWQQLVQHDSASQAALEKELERRSAQGLEYERRARERASESTPAPAAETVEPSTPAAPTPAVAPPEPAPIAPAAPPARSLALASYDVIRALRTELNEADLSTWLATCEEGAQALEDARRVLELLAHLGPLLREDHPVPQALLDLWETRTTALRQRAGRLKEDL